MASKKVQTAQVAVDQVGQHAISGMFKRGQIHEITYHTRRKVAVRSLVKLTRQTAVFNDAKGKKRTVRFSDIRGIKVPLALANQFKS